MDVTETHSEGLARSLLIVVPAADLTSELDTRLADLKDRIRLKGFRPGKVPVDYLKKAYGKSLMGEIIDDTVRKSSVDALEERALRPAMQPKIDFADDNDMDGVVAGKADLKYTIDLEIIPDFEPTDLSALAVDRPVAEVEDAQVEETIDGLRKQQTAFEARAEEEAAQDGDRVTLDFVGKLEGEAFEGGTAEGAQIVLGSGQMIPGFEDNLKGLKAGDERTFPITFPEDYAADHLAGKEAEFSVKVTEVAEGKEAELDDGFASNFGFETLDAMRTAVRENLGEQFKGGSRAHAKRRLLDALDAAHSFDLPGQMVDMEFNQLWSQISEADDVKAEIEDKGEDGVKADYRSIAERRVRLGLVLAEIGRRADVQVTEEEVNRGVMAQARQFPGREKELFEFYRQNPAALQQVRAPIFEDKVVDYILERAQVTDVPATRDEVMREPDEDWSGTGRAEGGKSEVASEEGESGEKT
ncbi:MAG: trigger factor [Pseudomonadota bacterium]